MPDAVVSATTGTDNWSTEPISRRERLARTAQLLDEASHAHGPARDKLLNEVIRLNLPVARSIAHRFSQRGELTEDLEQVAYLGLTKAVQGFDAGQGREFLAYAVPTITGEVKRYFRDVAWAVRPPRRLQELQLSISNAVQQLIQQLGRSPKVTELSTYLDRDLDEVIEALSCGGCFTPDSLDETRPEEESPALMDRLGTEDGNYARVEAIALMRDACRELPPRDRRVLYLRFFQGLTQGEIGLELGITQTQVSRLLTRITGELRNRLDVASQAPDTIAG
jgi:RNA polymerase sigma-B factor